MLEHRAVEDQGTASKPRLSPLGLKLLTKEEIEGFSMRL